MTRPLLFLKTMIDKANIIPAALERLKGLPRAITLMSGPNKRNRYMLFIRNGKDDFLVIENGFFQQRFENVPWKKIKKLFKTLLKKEFPRRTKIRVYNMGQYHPDQVEELKRKII